MKSVLLKLDDKLFEETEKKVKALQVSRNGYIKEAIADYNKKLERRALEEQLRREVAILKTYDPDKELKKIFETASLIDMQKYLDE
jgi:hypothetical protein